MNLKLYIEKNMYYTNANNVAMHNAINQQLNGNRDMCLSKK